MLWSQTAALEEADVVAAGREAPRETDAVVAGCTALFLNNGTLRVCNNQELMATFARISPHPEDHEPSLVTVFFFLKIRVKG